MKKFNVIKFRRSNSTLIYRVRMSDTITKDEVKLGEIHSLNLNEASLHMESRLDSSARGIYSTTGRI